MKAVLRIVFAMMSLIALVAPCRVMSAETDAAKPQAKQEALAYISVAGAPGDGEQALAVALGKRLSVAGVKTASALDTSVYSVEGIVKMTTAKGGRQAVRIDWTIFAPDGTTLGGVSQTKLVRKGSLTGNGGLPPMLPPALPRCRSSSSSC